MFDINRLNSELNFHKSKTRLVVEFRSVDLNIAECLIVYVALLLFK